MPVHVDEDAEFVDITFVQVRKCKKTKIPSFIVSNFLIVFFIF